MEKREVTVTDSSAELLARRFTNMPVRSTFDIRLSTGVKLAVYRPRVSEFKLKTNLGITISKISNSPNVIKQLASALSTSDSKKFIEVLRKLTLQEKLIWSTYKRKMEPAFLIYCLATNNRPEILVLLNDPHVHQPLKRCVDCPYRYSPVCKYCPLDGTCSRCGVRMVWSDKEKDWVCPLCGRTFTQDMKEATGGI